MMIPYLTYNLFFATDENNKRTQLRNHLKIILFSTILNINIYNSNSVTI